MHNNFKPIVPHHTSAHLRTAHAPPRRDPRAGAARRPRQRRERSMRSACIRHTYRPTSHTDTPRHPPRGAIASRCTHADSRLRPAPGLPHPRPLDTLARPRPDLTPACPASARRGSAHTTRLPRAHAERDGDDPGARVRCARRAALLCRPHSRQLLHFARRACRRGTARAADRSPTRAHARGGGPCIRAWRTTRALRGGRITDEQCTVGGKAME